MRAHLIENGIVANVIEVESLDDFPNLITATEGGIGWIWDGVSLSEPIIIPAVPPSVSPRQIRQALSRIGLRSTVESFIASADQDTKDWYEYATEFIRNNPHVISIGSSLDQSPEQLDDLWRLAGSL